MGLISRRTLPIAAALLAAMASFAICDCGLNPQPLPPTDDLESTGDASTGGSPANAGGSSSGGGSGFQSTGGSDDGGTVSPATDGGQVAVSADAGGFDAEPIEGSTPADASALDAADADLTDAGFSDASVDAGGDAADF